MKARTQSTRVRSTCAAAVLVLSTLTVISPRAAFSQLNLGSLVVTVTAPTSGANVSGTIPFSASVTIVGALTVQSVQFKVDGVVVGEDTSAPYSIPWNTKMATDGQHTLTACARDILGVVWDSEGVTVRVDNTPPAVSINRASGQADPTRTSPINFSVIFSEAVSGFAAGDVTIAGTAGGTKTVMVTGGPTAYNVAVSGMTDGAVIATIAAGAAHDAARNGNTGSTSTDNSVILDTTAPAVAVTSPAGGATVSGTVAVTADASDGVGIVDVRIFVDGAPLGVEDTQSPYQASWNTAGLANGSQHTISATARDAAGNTATAAPVSVTVSNDTTSPTVTINQAAGQADPTNVSPINFTVVFSEAVSNFTSADVAVGGTAGGIKSISVTGGPSTYTVAVSGMTSGTVIPSIPAGAATDAAGNGNAASTSTDPTVIFDAAPPAVAVTSPADGSTVDREITVTADASDDIALVGVQFRLDGASLGAEDTDAPYSIPWDTIAATDGSHTLTAVARDGAGNVTTSDAVTVTVSNGTSVRRFEDTDAAITYTPAGTWMERNTVRPWSGGTAALAFEHGQRATFSFNGTGVTWIGFRGPNAGTANVYLDGALVATVDMYAIAEELEAVIFTRAGLPAGPHSLVVEVPSPRAKNVASSDYYVVVDAFDVAGVASGPDTTPPAVAITSPGAGASVAATVAVTANASDTGGIAGVQFFLDGAMLHAEDTTAPYSVDWDTRTAADGSHRLTAVARDAAGNTTTSAAVTVTVANTAPSGAVSWTRFEETSLSITYTDGSGTGTDGTGATVAVPPGWFHASTSRGWSGGVASFNRSAGARATFRFTGTAVRWISFRAPWAGVARVSLDGGAATEIDLYSSTEHEQAVVYSATVPADGATHTLTIEVTGTRNSAVPITCPPTDCNAVVVDAFDVAPSSSVPPPLVGTRFEETDAAVSYPLLSNGTSGWTSDTAGAWSGGTARVSATAGARARFTFTGTEVRWIGLRGPGTGIADVFLDGVFHARVDTYSATEVQTVVFTATELADASHTLEIHVTGARHASATGSLIVVDAFDVRSRVEDRHASVAYAGSWVAWNMGRAWSGTAPPRRMGTAAITVTAGASAEFRFTGRLVSWIGLRGPQGGIARVSVDGTIVADVDTSAATEQVQAVLFTSSTLPDGPHTLRIEKIDPTSKWIVVDAFDTTPASAAPPVTRFQESAATYTGTGWTQSPDRLRSGGSGIGSATAGDEATLSFTGTAIRWIGHSRSDFGIAHIYVDGVFHAAVDMAATIEEAPYIVFRATGLAPGTHALRIVVMGRNGEAPGMPVAPILIDAFDIY